MQITRRSQCRNGMRVRGRLGGFEVNDAVLDVDHDGTVHVCQNVVSGNVCVDKHGYEYSWLVFYKNTDTLTEGTEIYNMFERSEAAMLRKDRVRLIRCMQSVLPKARENGDEAALVRIIEMVREDKDGQYLSYSQENPDKVSYASKAEHRVDNARRMRTTIGRYIRRQLGIKDDELSSDGMMKITNALFGRLTGAVLDDELAILTGEDIVRAYRDAVGASSCMTGGCSSYVQIYADNPDNVSLVVYKGMARALLWTCDDGQKVLDRIYPNDGAHVDALHVWAEAQGYLYRVSNSLPSGTVELSDGSVRKVTLDHDDVFPYMDTFHYGEVDGCRIELSNECGFGNMVMSATDGGAEDDRYTCEECGERINEDDVRYYHDSCYCDRCFDNNFSYCPRCDDYCPSEDMTHIDDVDEFWCTSCAESYAAMCGECGNWVSVWNTTSDGDALCEDCGEECDECGEYFRNEDLTEGMCDDCRETKEPDEDEEEVQLQATEGAV